MRGFLVKFVGFALYVHDLHSGTLTLTHQRPNRKPAEYILNEEDFEDSAGELDDETVATLEPGIEASAVGLSLRLIKNDGVLKATFESEHHGVADWTFHGLRGSDAGRMTACAFTQTASETSTGCKCTEILPPELSNSTIQTVSTHPIPDRISQPLASGLSMISTTETRPLKRKATEDIDQPIPHKCAKSTPKSPPWPNHLYMTCFRTHPISMSDIGTLHIDLIVGSVWFEGWYGKAHARTFEKKQIDLQDASTRVQYLLHCNGIRTGESTHNLKIARLRNRYGLAESTEPTPVFEACCSAPGWQIWGSNTDTSPGPEPTLSTEDQAKERESGIIRNIPFFLPTMTETNITPTIIVDAIVHCIDRATRRQPIHDPDFDDKLEVDYHYLVMDQAEQGESTELDKKVLVKSEEYSLRMNYREKHRDMDGENWRQYKTRRGRA